MDYGGIGTAVWGGVMLSEVLADCTPFDDLDLHVEFFGADVCHYTD